jgi:hypothetical protein
MLSANRPRKLATGIAKDSTLDCAGLDTRAGTVYVAVEAAAEVWVGLTVTLSGFTPVALPSKYHPPMSVKFP